MLRRYDVTHMRHAQTRLTMSKKIKFQSNQSNCPFTLFYYPSARFPPHAMSEDDVCTIWCLINGENRPFYLRANRNWKLAELADSILERRKDLGAGINDTFLWQVSVLLTSPNVPANFVSQVTKPTSIDPDNSFHDRFSCPISDLLGNSIVTRLNERMRRVSDVFPVLAEGQLHIVVQVEKSGKCA